MNSNQIIKKYRNTIISFLIIVSLLIVGMIIVAFKVTDYNKMTLINLILLVVLLVVALSYRSVLLGYKYLAGIARVIINQSQPLPFKRNIVKEFGVLLTDDFKVFTNNDNYQIMYKRVEDGKKIFKNKILYIVLLLKVEKLDFFDKYLHEDINKLEETFSKKERSNKQIVLAFKNFENVKEDNLKEIGEVVSYGAGRQFFTQINVGLNKKDSKAYFLYSDVYNPSASYRLGTEYIKRLIK